LGEPGAVAQVQPADIQVGAWSALGHFLQELLAHGAGEVFEIARHLDEGPRSSGHAMQIIAVESASLGKPNGLGRSFMIGRPLMTIRS
jgi:hypothetical protein